MQRVPGMLRLIMIVILALAATPLGFLQSRAEQSEPASPTIAQPENKAMATVNGATLYEGDLRGMTEALWKGSGKLDAPPEGDLALRREALKQLIEYELLYQDSLTLAPEELEKIEKQVEDTVSNAEKQSGGREKLVEQLAQGGLTLERARDTLRKNLLVRADVDQKVISKVQVSEEEIGAFYQANTERFKHEELIGARHILILVPKDATEEQKKAVLEKISALRKEISGGKDFAEVAKASSECPSKERGGDLGYFPKGTMVPEFEQVAYSLKEGEVSEPVLTQFGYHLILVYGRKPAGVWPFEEVRGTVETDLRNQKTQEAFNSYMENLRKVAKITILDQTLAQN